MVQSTSYKTLVEFVRDEKSAGSLSSKGEGPSTIPTLIILVPKQRLSY